MYLSEELTINCETCGSFKWASAKRMICLVCEKEICSLCKCTCSKCHLTVCPNCLLVLNRAGREIYTCFSCLQEKEICQMCGLEKAEITEELDQVLTIARTLCPSCALWQLEFHIELNNRMEKRNDYIKRVGRA